MIPSWLSIQPDHPLPIQVQLTEQIKWLVGTGKLKPEDKLSPVVSLAGELGINRNTVQAAYMQLREEGILQTQQGKGTWIADTDTTRELVRDRQQTVPFFHGLLDEADKLGADADRFALLGMAAIQLRNVVRARKVLLIGGREGEHAFFMDEIGRQTGATPELKLLEDIKEDARRAAEEAAFFNIVAVAHPYAEEVCRLIPELADRTVAIAPVIELKTIVEMARLGEKETIGLLFGNATEAAWMAKHAVPPELNCEFAVASDLEGTDALIRRSAIVYAAPSVYDRAGKLFPEKVELLRLKLEISGLTALMKA